MTFVFWILFGAVAGVVATRLMPGPRSEGSGTGILFGIAGGVLGGLVGSASTGLPLTTFDTYSLATAVCGSLILLFCYRCLATRQAY